MKRAALLISLLTCTSILTLALPSCDKKTATEEVIIETPAAEATPDEEPNPEWLNEEEAVADAV